MMKTRYSRGGGLVATDFQFARWRSKKLVNSTNGFKVSPYFEEIVRRELKKPS